MKQFHITDANNPVWSPDGQRIVYSSSRDGDWEIYVMDADGKTASRLTNSDAQEGDPSWKP
ncbi:MAG: hypothetical protein U9R58_05070 [Chloroflexota bacterium]|nr:hypothetical protein [Chloroflexota bacterium]